MTHIWESFNLQQSSEDGLMHFLIVACSVSQLDSATFTLTCFATLGKSFLSGTHFLLWKTRWFASPWSVRVPSCLLLHRQMHVHGHHCHHKAGQKRRLREVMWWMGQGGKLSEGAALMSLRMCTVILLFLGTGLRMQEVNDISEAKERSHLLLASTP